MRPLPIVVSAAVAFVLMASAGVASAQGTAAPSESDLGQALAPKSRGLPTMGTLPPAPPNPSIESTSTAPPPPHNPKPKPVTPASAPADVHPSATLRSIQFQFGSAQLTPDSIDTLKNLGNALNHELADQPHFRIEGHTDAYGEAGLNDKLSQERADAVKDYLVKEMGVAGGRLEAVGKGSSEPIAGSSPFSAVNRRVVVVNLES